MHVFSGAEERKKKTDEIEALRERGGGLVGRTEGRGTTRAHNHAQTMREQYERKTSSRGVSIFERYE